MRNSIFPEGEPVALSYCPGDLPGGNILFSDSYKRKSPKRVESVLELISPDVFISLGALRFSKQMSVLVLFPMFRLS